MPLPFFFFNDTATTEIYTLSLHDALPISADGHREQPEARRQHLGHDQKQGGDEPDLPFVHGEKLARGDRKSTRLNSSHSQISYAVFCLKKKKKIGMLVASCRTM